ncbi:MAG: DUF4870 domain-containing protein [Planctomycetota bacterium]|nr:MAG: DUF4870 domain-containing protein [Planctomycetota bacterium]
MDESSPYHRNLDDEQQQSQPQAVDNPSTDTITSADKTPAVLAHLLAFSGYILPFAHIIAPLVVYLLKKDDSAYARHHAAESLNFQISMTIYMLISLLLVLVLIGILFMLILIVVDIILIIVAAVRASDEQWYRYPLCIRFVH